MNLFCKLSGQQAQQFSNHNAPSMLTWTPHICLQHEAAICPFNPGQCNTGALQSCVKSKSGIDSLASETLMGIGQRFLSQGELGCKVPVILKLPPRRLVAEQPRANVYSAWKHARRPFDTLVWSLVSEEYICKACSSLASLCNDRAKAEPREGTARL